MHEAPEGTEAGLEVGEAAARDPVEGRGEEGGFLGVTGDDPLRLDRGEGATDPVEPGCGLLQAAGDEVFEPFLEKIEGLRPRTDLPARLPRLDFATEGEQVPLVQGQRSLGPRLDRIAETTEVAQQGGAVGAAFSAAALGVGSRRSATKSAIVKSISCPTPDITGMEQAAMARATTSSLKAQRSSMLPPPRAMMTRSGRWSPLASSKKTNSGGDFRGGSVALDAGGVNDDPDPRRPPGKHVDHVADRGSRRRGDDADAGGKGRNGLFPGRIEEPLGLELPLEGLELRLEIAEALRLDDLGDELILAARLVDGKVSRRPAPASRPPSRTGHRIAAPLKKTQESWRRDP